MRIWHARFKEALDKVNDNSDEEMEEPRKATPQRSKMTMNQLANVKKRVQSDL